MSRWRPPAPKSSPYVTPQGLATLQSELKGLWERRGHVTQALSAAAAEGDRSENAEYIYRKKELREIDRRIRYLQKRIPALSVVQPHPPTQRQIFFGAWVTVEDPAGEEMTVRIVGADEIDPGRSWISVDSPIARGLLRKTVDDAVRVGTPEGEAEYFVVAVSYVAPQE